MTYSTRETLVGREPHVRKRSLPAGLDRGLEHRIELVRRNHELTPERLVPRDQRPVPREPLFQFVEDLLKVRIGIGRRDRVVERFRLLVERHPLAFQHADAGGERRKLPLEVLMAQPRHLVGTRLRCSKIDQQLRRTRSDGVQPRLGGG